MKTRFSIDSKGRVIIRYADQERTYTCPVEGGYVFELLPEGGQRQVFESNGNALTAPSRAELLGVIKREYRKLRRAEKRG